MIKYYTLIVTRNSEIFDDETLVQSFENYELFTSYVLNNAGNPDVIEQRLLKTELGHTPKVTELKLSFKDNLVVFKEGEE